MAWEYPSGISHVITADSLMAWSSEGCAHKSHLGGTGAIQKIRRPPALPRFPDIAWPLPVLAVKLGRIGAEAKDAVDLVLARVAPLDLLHVDEVADVQVAAEKRHEDGARPLIAR